MPEEVHGLLDVIVVDEGDNMIRKQISLGEQEQSSQSTDEIICGPTDRHLSLGGAPLVN